MDSIDVLSKSKPNYVEPDSNTQAKALENLRDSIRDENNKAATSVLVSAPFYQNKLPKLIAAAATLALIFVVAFNVFDSKTSQVSALGKLEKVAANQKVSENITFTKIENYYNGSKTEVSLWRNPDGGFRHREINLENNQIIKDETFKAGDGEVAVNDLRGYPSNSSDLKKKILNESRKTWEDALPETKNISDDELLFSVINGYLSGESEGFDLISPEVRSALFGVLKDIDGLAVSDSAKDLIGRESISISFVSKKSIFTNNEVMRSTLYLDKNTSFLLSSKSEVLTNGKYIRDSYSIAKEYKEVKSFQDE